MPRQEFLPGTAVAVAGLLDEFFGVEFAGLHRAGHSLGHAAAEVLRSSRFPCGSARENRTAAPAACIRQILPNPPPGHTVFFEFRNDSGRRAAFNRTCENEIIFDQGVVSSRKARTRPLTSPDPLL